MAKPETKTVTRTIAVPKTKRVKQQTPTQTTPKDTEPTNCTPILQRVWLYCWDAKGALAEGRKKP